MKALYILSSPRGGSTLLSYILGRNSQITNMGEVSFIPKLLALSESCSCGETLKNCPAWKKVFLRLYTSSHIDMRENPYGFDIGEVIKRGGGKADDQHQIGSRIIKAKLRGLIDRIMLQLPVDTFNIKWTPSWTRLSLKNTFLLYEAAAAAWGTSLIVDASKLNRKGLNLYRSDPARVRLLHLSRDGRGVVASRKNIVPIEKAAHQWNRYHNDTLNWVSKWVKPEHYRSMRYEDLAESPESELRELCQWLDIEFDPHMTDFTDDLDIHFAGGNLPARSKMASGIRKIDEKWKTSLSEKEIETFTKIGGKTNLAFGYD